MAGLPSALITEARKRWTKCADAESDQRKRILLAKKFRAGDQWPAAIKLAREGAQSIAGQPAQPPRPCLVVDRLSQPVRQTSNTIKNASFGFDVLPNGAGADTETAEIYKGYMRRVSNGARGESPVEWAADGAIEGGIGWFRLRTEYVHDTWDGDPNDPEVFDQELRMERITNNLTVYDDPSAMKPTRSDAKFKFVVEDLDKDEFKARWPKADIRGLEEFKSTGDMKGWVSEDTIRIAEYWRIEYSTRTFCELTDGTIVEKTKDSPKYEKDDIKRERVMRVPTVKCDKINAIESLEQYEWVGTRIPLIPVLGEELNVDGKPVLRGIIDEGMDAQRMVNYTYSGAMEIFALSNKKPPMVPFGSIAQYKNIWDTRTTTNWSYLPFDPFDDMGRPMPPPMPDVTESPIQAAVELMRTSEEAIKATTSTGDASLGNSHPNERSGRALQALQAASDLSNSNYPDNVRRALIYAAELMVEVIPKITRKGQILQILGMDEEPKQVMAGQPFKEGANGIPEAAPPEVTPEMAKLKESLYQFYDLNNGRYAVTVSVGKATATKREEGAAALGELIPHLPPEMAAVATPDYVEQLSFPGAFKIAEKLRKALPPQLQEKKEGEAPDPALLAQQLQQVQGQLQQATQFIQTKQAEAQGTIQSAQIKAQADLQAAKLDADLQIQIAHINNAAKVEVARIGAAKAVLDTQAAAQEERLSTGLELQHEAEQNALDRHHQAGMAQQQTAVSQQAQGAQQSHEQEMAAQGQAVSQAEADASRQHEQQMAQDAAERAAQQPNGSGV